MQSSSKFEEAFLMVDAENETPIFARECRVQKNLFITKKRLIILTERNLFYFSKRMRKHKYNLFKINNIYIDKKKIILIFEKESQIKIALPNNWTQAKEGLVDSLFYVIQHLLTNSGISRIHLEINVDNLPNSRMNLTSIPSYYGAFCHLESSLRDEFFNFDAQSNDIFDQIRFRFSILFHRKSIELCSYKNHEYATKLIFETLPLLPSARFLSIKQYNTNNVFMILNNYINDIGSLQNLSIDGDSQYQNDTVSFEDFMNKIKQDLNSKMVGLSFSNSNFTENHLNLISQYISIKKIQALEFHNSFSNKTVVDFFINTFLTSLQQCPDFTSLYIDEVEALDYDKLLKNVPPQIKSLSIVNCDIPINQILNTIKTDSKFSNNLSVLNLSFNTVDTYQPAFLKDLKFNIPSFLTVIILDYISFPYGILVPFLNSLFRSINNDSVLSLVQMNASDDDFNNLDKMFMRLVNDFTKKKEDLRMFRCLKWDFNPISTYFMSFLEMQTSLLELSVSGCFCPKDSKCFDDFCRFIASSNSLSKLTCRRFNKVSLESLTPRLLKAVSVSKISCLDISNSHGGSRCFQYLKSLVINNINKSKMNFDTSEDISYSTINNNSNTNLINNNNSNTNLTNNNNDNDNDNINLNNTNSNEKFGSDQFASNIPINQSSVQNTSESFHTYTNPSILKMPALRCLMCDGLHPLNKEQLIDFIEFVGNDELSCKCSFPIHDIEYLFKRQKIGFEDIAKIISLCLIKTPDDFVKPFTVFYKESQNKYPFYFREENEEIQLPQPAQPEVADTNPLLCEGNEFEVTEMPVIKTGNFFGLYHDKSINVNGSDPYFFSFHSDDDEDEYSTNNENGNNSFDNNGSKRRTFALYCKHPNSKRTDISLTLPPDESNQSDNEIPSLILEEEEEELSLPSPARSPPKSGLSVDQKTQKKLPLKKDYDYDDDYDYYSQELENNKKQAPLPVIKSGIRPLIKPFPNRMLNGPPLRRNVINNNTVKKKPVVLVKLDNSSDYYSYSYAYDEDNDNSYSYDDDVDDNKNKKSGTTKPSLNAKKGNTNTNVRPNMNSIPATVDQSKNKKQVDNDNSNNNNDNDNNNVVNDLPPLLTGDIDPAYNNIPNVKMSPNKYENLKQLQTDSYSSGYGDEEYEN